MSRARFIMSLLFLCAASISHAQTAAPALRLEATVGHAAFLDEDPVDHVMFGSVIQYPLSPRVWVGPEAVYMIGPGNDRDLFLTGNIWFDLIPPQRAGVRRITPYLVAGTGFMRHTEEFLPNFAAYEWAFTGGAGVRIRLGDGWYLAPEARLGWEPHSRVSAAVGYTFTP